MPEHLDRRRLTGDDALGHACQPHEHRYADGRRLELVNRRPPDLGAEGGGPNCVQHSGEDEVGQGEHVLVVLALGLLVVGRAAQARLHQELLEDGITLDGKAPHRVSEVDRAEQVDELKRYGVVGEAFHERVDGRIRRAGLDLPACWTRYAERAQRGGGRDGPL